MSAHAAGAVSCSTLAKLLNLTERRIRQLADQGIVIRSGRNQYAVAASVQRYTAYLSNAGRGGSREADTLSGERLRLMTGRASLVELDRDERAGRLLSAEEVEARWIGAVSIARSRVLAIPSKMAPRLAGLSSAAKIRAALETEFLAALSGLPSEEVDDAKN